MNTKLLAHLEHKRDFKEREREVMLEKVNRLGGREKGTQQES
jgi:hypothetical protein